MLVRCDRPFTTETSTALSQSGSQLSDAGNDHRSTITAATPASYDFREAGKRLDGDQSTKPCSSQIHPWPAESFVEVLLSPSSPTAIFLGIRSIIIRSIKGVLWCRSTSHILQKIRIACFPAITHADAATTVAVVPRIRWIGAAMSCCPPGFVFRSNNSHTRHYSQITSVWQGYLD